MRLEHNNPRSGKLTSLTTYRQAFTMLELIIALALLGVLSVLAWSILDNFQNAEQRGWKLSSRLQTIRSARLWLEEDLQHVSQSLANSQPSSLVKTPSNLPTAFDGSSTGFSIRYAPSIDPLPWLEELLVSSTDTTTLTPTLQSSARLGLYSIEANYRISGGTSLSKTIRSLAPQQFSGDSSGMNDEPLLTTADLYRNVDRSSSQQSSTNILSTSNLDSLYRARFRYSDGKEWKTSWKTTNGDLPAAIEFSFDLDAPEDQLELSSKSQDPEENNSALASERLAEQIDEPTVEVDEDVANSTLQEPRQIRIVVYLPWSTTKLPSTDAQGDTGSTDSDPASSFNDLSSPSPLDSSYLAPTLHGGTSS